MAIEGIVFDLDATLVNLGGFVEWREAHRRAVEAYLACGVPNRLISRCSDKGLFNMLNLVRDNLYRSKPASEVERIQARVYSAIESCEILGITPCHLMPHCVPTLEWLRDKGIIMGVATSNSQGVAEQILEAKGVHSFFDAVIGRRPELRMKPYPDQILQCFMEMGVAPNFGVVVGDSVWDVMASKSAGVYVIAVPSFFTKCNELREAGVDIIIENLGELPRAISELEIKSK